MIIDRFSRRSRRMAKRFEIVSGIIILCFFNIWKVQGNNNNDRVPMVGALRLPTSIFPLRYQIHIETNIHKEIFDFHGNVSVDISIRSDTDRIILHSRDLTDFVVELEDLVRSSRGSDRNTNTNTNTNSNSNSEIIEINHTYDNRTNFLTIFAKNRTFIAGQEYRLRISYNGIIQSRPLGFYWSTYLDANDKVVYLGATQFEPTSARSAFPCFDEPAFKAKFIVRITHGRNYTALSNMPIDGSPVVVCCSNGENMTTTTFLETPQMSTYLIAFVVSNYDRITEELDGISQSVYSPPHLKDRGEKSLKNAIKSLSVMEEYFGVKYPLPKLDHITLKKTYQSAMENWGLITYNMNTFLENSESNQHRILMNVLTQNHEIAHQWFGNLVSPEWWTFSWINEGFATYFGYIATDLVHPELHAMDFFINDVANIAFSWPFNRPMSHYVENETEIKSVFDVVSYQRAACIIKMFHHAFNQSFIRGIEMFLTDFQYSAVNEDHLFDSIQRAIYEDVNQHQHQHQHQHHRHHYHHHFLHHKNAIKEIMRSWTHNEGTPILSVLRNYEDNSIVLRQRSTIRNSNELWWIPINFATSAHPDFENTKADYIMPPEREVILYPEKENLSISTVDENHWLIVNKQQTGFYHVAYDERSTMLIANALSTNYTAIHYLNRALIFRDIQALLEKSEISSIDEIFEILKYLQYEDNLLPWNSATDTISMLTSNLFGTETYEIYKDFIRSLISPIFHKIYRIPKNNLTVNEQSSRQKIISEACKVDLIECLQFAKETAKNYIFKQIEMQYSTEIEDSLLRNALLCHGVKNLNADEFHLILDKLGTLETNSEFYEDIIYSLRCSENSENLLFFLNLLLRTNSTHTLMSDAEFVHYMYFLYSSKVIARPIVVKFIEENYKLLWRLDLFVVLLRRIAGYVSEQDAQKYLDLLERIEKEHILHQPEEEYHISIDRKKLGLKSKKKEIFLRNFGKSITRWLKGHEQSLQDTALTPSHNSGGAGGDGRGSVMAVKLLRKFVSFN